MSVSTGLPLAMIGISFFLYHIGQNQEGMGAYHKKQMYYLLSLFFIWGSIVVMANLATNDSLTAVNEKMEALFVIFGAIITLEVWIVFISLVIQGVGWFNEVRKTRGNALFRKERKA